MCYSPANIKYCIHTAVLLRFCFFFLSYVSFSLLFALCNTQHSLLFIFLSLLSLSRSIRRFPFLISFIFITIFNTIRSSIDIGHINLFCFVFCFLLSSLYCYSSAERIVSKNLEFLARWDDNEPRISTIKTNH